MTHGGSNGVVDTYAKDPNNMLRPASISAAKGVSTIWSSGGYQYDGAGNIKRIGSSYFLYDPVSRLVDGHVYDAAVDPGTVTPTKFQTYSYDAYGNITAIGGTSGRTTPTAPGSNHLTGGNYDNAGNLKSWSGQQYEYDAFNQMTRFCSATPCPAGAGQEWLYMYNADDERIWSFKVGANPRFDRFALRGMDGKVLREYANSGYTFGSKTDYVYRDGLLLATESPTGQRHFHLDHLGTPRATTNFAGALASYQTYYPFGEEILPAGATSQNSERLRFTGHEADLGATSVSAGSNPQADDLTYMHARHASSLAGRFLSMDVVGPDATAPQTWNRYAYVVGNPLKYTDPDGNRALPAVWPGVELTLMAYDAWNTYQVVTDPTASTTKKAWAVGLTGVGLVTLGGGYAKKGAEVAERIAVNFAKGRSFEKAAIAALDATKNTERIVVEGLGRSIPDVLGRGIIEFKNQAKISLSLQFRVQLGWARLQNVPLNLVVGPETKYISGPLQQAVRNTGGNIFVFDPTTGLYRLWSIM